MNILKNSEESRREIVAKIEAGGIVILPSNGVYTFNTNIFNEKSIEKIYMLKERDMNTPLGVAVKDFEMAKPLINISDMSEKELLIIKTLIKEFWPGMLTIVVKTHLDNPLFTAESYISLESPCHTAVKSILTAVNKPIITTSANINKKTSCTHISHVKNYYENIDSITALADTINPKYGIENTILKIVGNNLYILRPGIITKSDIESVLDKHSISYSINYKDDEKHGVSEKHYSIDKNCLLANFVTSDMLDKTINTYTLKYLSNSILVDFGKRNIEKKDIVTGYVDLSENGDIKEALFNIYDVLHQLNNIDKPNILFMDLYNSKTDLYKTMTDKLTRCCNNRRIMIPLHYD